MTFSFVNYMTYMLTQLSPLFVHRSYSSLLCSVLHFPGRLVCAHHVCHAADLGRTQTHLARQALHTRYGRLKMHEQRSPSVYRGVTDSLLSPCRSQAWSLDPKQMRPLRLSTTSRTPRAGTCTLRPWTSSWHVSPPLGLSYKKLTALDYPKT